MSKPKVQMKSKAQITKKNKGGWNDGILEYWAKQKVLAFLYIILSFRYSIIP
jgi:hypothetical protein